ncbi:MAG TPA: hypothetical protein VFZ61_25715 [Polyangiales bacterium]
MRFACDADRAASSTVELRIRRGGCADHGPDLFAAVLSPGEQVPVPEGLREGAHSFVASAKQGTRVVASACDERTLPSSAPILTLLTSDACDASAPALEDGGSGAAPDTQVPEPEIDAGSDGDATLAPGTDAAEDARSDATPSGDASVDAGSCDCAGCDAACACAAVSCFTTRLFLTYATPDADTWSPTAALSLGAGDIARVGWAPEASEGQRLVQPPAARIVLEALGFASAAAIDAFALLPDGRYVFSTRDDETFRGEPFDDDDLIAFEPLSQAVSRHLDLGSLLSSVSDSDVDVDALHVAANGDLYFSVAAQVKAASAVLGPGDLLRLGNSGVERLVSGADVWPGRDLESLGVDPVSGHFVASFVGDGVLGDDPHGARFGAADAVLLGFGPGQPYASGYQLFFRGNVEFSSASGSLSALHCGD